MMVFINLYSSKQCDIDELIRDFDYSVSINKEMEGNIKKAYEDLDPLKAYQLF